MLRLAGRAAMLWLVAKRSDKDRRISIAVFPHTARLLTPLNATAHLPSFRQTAKPPVLEPAALPIEPGAHGKAPIQPVKHTPAPTRAGTVHRLRFATVNR
jgi:hypothetical protein